MHGEAIRHAIRNMCRLDDTIVKRFHLVIGFDIGAHHVNMLLCQDPHREFLPTQFIITEEEVE